MCVGQIPEHIFTHIFGSTIPTSLAQGFQQVQNSEVFVARVWAGPKFWNLWRKGSGRSKILKIFFTHIRWSNSDRTSLKYFPEPSTERTPSKIIMKMGPRTPNSRTFSLFWRVFLDSSRSLKTWRPSYDLNNSRKGSHDLPSNETVIPIAPPWVDSSKGPHWVNRAHWPTKENRQIRCILFDFSGPWRKLPGMAPNRAGRILSY